MKCYIAGPMSGLPEFNFPAFDAARDNLAGRGYEVTSPADLDRAAGFDEQGTTGHEALSGDMKRSFARRDIAALLDVDEVWVLPGWENSTGARNEVSIAGWLGVPVKAYPTGEKVGGTAEWSGAPNARASLLREAESLVNGDRNTQYGDPRQDFIRTATMWGAYLGCDIGPHDVAAMMALLKVSRIRWSPGKRDSWADLAGYAACGWHCVAPEEQT